MEKKAFVVEACLPGAIGEYRPKLVILAKDREEAIETLKKYGLEYGISAGYADIITYNWPATISRTRCELVELPILDAEKVPA